MSKSKICHIQMYLLCIACNQRQNKTNVHMGGTYVDKIVLSKRFFAIDEFKPYFLEHDRVFWEKFS